MSTAFQEIQEGLQTAIEHAKGNNSKVILHKPQSVDVKSLRAKLNILNKSSVQCLILLLLY
jgi:hypothetical protein